MLDQVQNAKDERHMGGAKSGTGTNHSVDRSGVLTKVQIKETGKGQPVSTESSKQADKGPRKNDGSFAWKDVPPRAGEPTTNVVKGKTYYWCTHHPNQMWALHNPTAFPDLCRLHPKYVEMEAAHKAKKQGGAGGKELTAADIQLSQAMAAIEGSGSEESYEE
jgi:hypothetical protein